MHSPRIVRRRVHYLLLITLMLSGCISNTGTAEDSTPPVPTPRVPAVGTVGEPNTPFTIAAGGTHMESFRLAQGQTVTALLDLRKTSDIGLVACIFDKAQYERFENRRPFTGYACRQGWTDETGQDQLYGGSEYPGTWYYLGIRCGDDRYDCTGEFTLRLVEN